MANVLTLKDRTILRRNYWLRLTVVFSFILTASVVIGLVSLIPAYLSASAQLLETTLDSEVQGKSHEADEGASVIAAAQLANFQVEELLKTETAIASQSIDTIMKDWEVHAEDIIISSFVYSLIEQKKDFVPQIRISGEARNRFALNTFVQTLRANAAFADVSFPVSDLAGGEDVDFSLVIQFKQ